MIDVGREIKFVVAGRQGFDMEITRAKFVVNSIDDRGLVHLSPVYTPDKNNPNYAWWNASPNGKASFYVYEVANKGSASMFSLLPEDVRPGDNFYIDITKVDYTVEDKNGLFYVTSIHKHYGLMEEARKINQVTVELARVGCWDRLSITITNPSAYAIFNERHYYLTSTQFVPREPQP